ncbi:uncharacterized protein DS421_5g149130 [Arachis hypogaea]|nr:uncharacterized protein DS421_5g149130 [Arachis hypogaea]
MQKKQKNSNFEFLPEESTELAVQVECQPVEHTFENSIPGSPPTVNPEISMAKDYSAVPKLMNKNSEERTHKPSGGNTIWTRSDRRWFESVLAHLEEKAPVEEEVVIQGGGSTAEGLNRPPPKPLYLFTKAVVGKATATGAGRAAVLPRANGTIAKVEGCDTVYEGGGWAQSGKNDDVMASTSTRGRDLQAWGFCCVSPLVVRPPKLLGVVFPWNQDGGRSGEGLHARVVASGRGRENLNSEQRRDESWCKSY